MLDDNGAYDVALVQSRFTTPGSVAAVRSGRYKLIRGLPGRDDWHPMDPGARAGPRRGGWAIDRRV